MIRKYIDLVWLEATTWLSKNRNWVAAGSVSIVFFLTLFVMVGHIVNTAPEEKERILGDTIITFN